MTGRFTSISCTCIPVTLSSLNTATRISVKHPCKYTYVRVRMSYDRCSEMYRDNIRPPVSTPAFLLYPFVGLVQWC
jgi:hypothetical protein